MADKPKPTLPPAAQAAAVREMLKNDHSLTLEGIETHYPELAEGARIVLEEMRSPQKATSGSAPLTPKPLSGTI